MTPFHERLVRRAGTVWRLMLRHEFLRHTAAGTIPDEAFVRWIQQDYLYVRALVPYLHLVAAGAPPEDQRMFAEAVAFIHREIEFFERAARRLRVALPSRRNGRETMAPTCHAYVSFLMTVARSASYPEALATLYCLDRAYIDAWSRVGRRPGRSRWKPFIAHWSAPLHRAWVRRLGRVVDRAAAGASGKVRESMAALFVATTRYEILFWDMVFKGERWPG